MRLTGVVLITIKNMDKIGIYTVEQIRFIDKRFEGKGVVLYDCKKAQSQFIEKGYKVKLEEADNIALIECDNLEEIKQAFEKFKKKLFVTSRVLKFYDLYDFFEKKIDDFKIYNITETPNNDILCAEVWK